jgi:phosphoribosylaminoimidazole-succinocarboxamide synthase
MSSTQDLCLRKSDFSFPNQTKVYHGKVRDVYTIGKDVLLMVASDRISAFDHILHKAIPYKGQVLNQIAEHFLTTTQDIVPNWYLASPDPNVTIGSACEPFKVEMVIRGYLAGHAWRTYQAGGRVLCGVKMPEGLSQNDAFPFPIITPTTKASEGHDEDISKEDILSKGIVNAEDWAILEKYTHALYTRGQEMANERGLILVDTKYEFGKVDGKIFLIDEIHTPDSSRYFYLEGYADRQSKGESQLQLSKEFVREWLMDNGFQGKEGQTMPVMPEEFVMTVSDKYISLYEQITGKLFIKADVSLITKRIKDNVESYLLKSNI